MANQLQEPNDVLWFVVFIVEGFVIISCNILSLIIFVRKFRHCKSCFLLINLATADLLVGCFIIVTRVLPVTRKSPESNISFVEKYLPDNILLLVAIESFLILGLIALERAFAVFKPFRHRALKTKHYQYATMATWFLCAVPAICDVILDFGHVQRDIATMITLALSGVLVTTSLFIMIISYTSIYIKLRFFPIFQHNDNTQMQMKLCTTLCSATLASIATALPFFALKAYRNACGGTCVVSENVQEVTTFFGHSNSFINLLVYAWKMPEFGKELRDIVCTCTRFLRARKSRVEIDERKTNVFTLQGARFNNNKN